MNIGKSSFDVEHHLRLAVGFRWGIVVDAAVVALGDLGGRDTTLHQFVGDEVGARCAESLVDSCRSRSTVGGRVKGQVSSDPLFRTLIPQLHTTCRQCFFHADAWQYLCTIKNEDYEESIESDWCVVPIGNCCGGYHLVVFSHKQPMECKVEDFISTVSSTKKIKV